MPDTLHEAHEGAVRVGLLRSFHLNERGCCIDLPPSVQRLVAFLALADRPLRRLHVAGSLWLDATEEHANACLRTALWRLGRTGIHVIDATSTQLSLSSDVVVDVHDVMGAAQRALAEGTTWHDRSYAPLHSIGELLPDWYDDWVIIERERVRQVQLRALEALCHQLAHAGRYAESVAAGLTAISIEPLRESANRALIETYLAEDNACDALRQYRVYRGLLKRDLGLAPSPALEHLLEPLTVR